MFVVFIKNVHIITFYNFVWDKNQSKLRHTSIQTPLVNKNGNVRHLGCVVFINPTFICRCHWKDHVFNWKNSGRVKMLFEHQSLRTFWCFEGKFSKQNIQLLTLQIYQFNW